MLEFIFDSVCREVLKVRRLPLSSLISMSYDRYEFIVHVRGTPYYIVKSREYRHGFMNVTDIVLYLLCKRKLYTAYNIMKIIKSIRLSKIAERLREHYDYIREGGVVYDEEILRRILVGTVMHKCLENAVKLVSHWLNVETEVEVVDYEHGIIGHVDIVEYIDDKTINIYEFKSGLFERPSLMYMTQAQMYAYLMERVHRAHVSSIYIVNPVIRSDGPTYNVHQIPYNDNIKRSLVTLLVDARKILKQDRIPEIKYDPNLCTRCTYRLLCLYTK